MGNEKLDISEELRAIIIKSEKYLNSLIKRGLNEPIVVKNTSLGLRKHGQLLRSLREYMEILALQLNLPTKNDVANIGELLVQIEEKLDNLEEKILVLTEEGRSFDITDEISHDTSPKMKQTNLNQGKHALRKLLRDNLINNSLNSQTPEDLFNELMKRRE